MRITYDSAKNAKNIESRGIAFDRATEMEWGTILVRPDRRRDYGEERYRIWGRIGGRLHVLVFTPRAGEMRVISLRKANRKEERWYAKEKARS